RVLAAIQTLAPGSSLAGLPIAVKDNVDTAGIPTTSGSLVDRDRVPAKDAVAWKRLRDHGGAVLLGKTHMSEFAYRVHHRGLGRGYLLAGAQRAVLDCWSDAVARLGAAGCQISEIRLPDAKRWRSMHRTILLSEAWRFHARRVLAGEPYGPLFRAAIGEAKRISPESYQAALEVRL